MKSPTLITSVFIMWLITFPFLHAQNISGTWHGKLEIPTGSLTILLHINQNEDGTYETTLDSPNQGAVNIICEKTFFKDSILNIQIPLINASYKGTLNADNTIKGTFTQGMSFPLSLKKGDAVKPLRPQEPVAPFPYISEEVNIKNEQDGIILSGTLTLPKKGDKFPAAILITGSGAQNRDEEIMGHKPFLVIADHLTRNGIAVLRCDDRGTAASQGIFANATNEDFAKDTEAMLNYLRGRKEIDAGRIGAIGHSNGGTIAFRVAAENPDIAFIVSLAGTGVRGDSLMLKQVELISKSRGMPDSTWQQISPTIRARYALLRQPDKTTEELQKELYADATKTISPEQLRDLNVTQRLYSEINSMTSPWYLHFMRYNPEDDMKKVKCPVLALNGEKDLQVDADMNLNAIRQGITENGNKHVTIKAYPKLNHLFQTCEKGTPEEYGQLEETINREVLKDMTEWILNIFYNKNAY